MTPEEQIKNLREQIAYHSDRYYNQDNPEISDYEFDQLMLELKRLEREHPERSHRIHRPRRWAAQRSGRRVCW